MCSLVVITSIDVALNRAITLPQAQLQELLIYLILPLQIVFGAKSGLQPACKKKNPNRGVAYQGLQRNENRNSQIPSKSTPLLTLTQKYKLNPTIPKKVINNYLLLSKNSW